MNSRLLLQKSGDDENMNNNFRNYEIFQKYYNNQIFSNSYNFDLNFPPLSSQTLSYHAMTVIINL